MDEDGNTNHKKILAIKTQTKLVSDLTNGHAMSHPDANCEDVPSGYVQTCTHLRYDDKTKKVLK